jgi:multicomponent Na+:H+ antiporter subunit E
MRPLVRVALLSALWLLAWGQISVANVISGVAVAVALLVAFPPSPSRSAPVRISVRGAMRLAGYVAVQLVTSNIVMTREVLRQHSTIQPGVLAHRLRYASEHVVTVMTSVIALSPGTMTVDVDRGSSTIYVHFLFLHDISSARAALDRLEWLASRSIVADRGTQNQE